MSQTTLQKLEFSNLFSYGPRNQLELSQNKITQLTAVNGSGKSSLALIIQELLYSKNVKGIKKGDLLNRWSKDKSWDGAIYFTCNGKQYSVTVTRTGATTKVKLLENGVDISEHKVLDTYKKIQDIIGLDFEIFSQLTYQSSTDLLDFLKATDTNRKKFLINLFNLERYIEIGERIKAQTSTLEKELARTQGELKSIEDFLATVYVPEPMSEVEVPAVDVESSVRIVDIQREISNIKDTCKRIDKNNMLISEQEGLRFNLTLAAPKTPDCMSDAVALEREIIILENELKTLKRDLANVKINDTCTACGQPIDTSHLVKIQTDLKAKIATKEAQLSQSKQQAVEWDTEIAQFKQDTAAYTLNQQKILRFEQLSQLIDKSLPTEYPDYNLLVAEQTSLESVVAEQTRKQSEAIAHNKKVSAHNAKIEALREQKLEFLVRQTAIKEDILTKSNEVNYLSILKKAFSTSGIVAFKLENLTKELETTINYYLSVLSDGQFQVEFALDKEKLNINVINNGVSAPIETVSGGEFSRIQTSILLAI
jgi:DNA repair exonuclease SbcCD ATPase subunit